MVDGSCVQRCADAAGGSGSCAAAYMHTIAWGRSLLCAACSKGQCMAAVCCCMHITACCRWQHCLCCMLAAMVSSGGCVMLHACSPFHGGGGWQCPACMKLGAVAAVCVLLHAHHCQESLAGSVVLRACCKGQWLLHAQHCMGRLQHCAACCKRLLVTCIMQCSEFCQVIYSFKYYGQWQDLRILHLSMLKCASKFIHTYITSQLPYCEDISH